MLRLPGPKGSCPPQAKSGGSGSPAARDPFLTGAGKVQKNCGLSIAILLDFLYNPSLEPE